MRWKNYDSVILRGNKEKVNDRESVCSEIMGGSGSDHGKGTPD